VLEAALLRNTPLGPQTAQQRDLLFHPATTGGEVLPQRFVLDLIPAESHPEAKSAPAQQINLGGLLGHQCGRTLG
jgi:hypothetical protein